MTVDVDGQRRKKSPTVLLKIIEYQHTRYCSTQLGVCHSAVWRIMHKQGVHPYHLQKVQLLQPDDYPKYVELALLLMQKGVRDLSFIAFVLSTEVCSIHIIHMCGLTVTFMVQEITSFCHKYVCWNQW
ncbi:hypothetical protein TNCT_309031 [Trichonephila clavata]|uniref:Transposase n=1 Tax=Trichonephila clavata TaxID=2740835 RepID=A0A8X6HL03_TRICU|nr:hypothetical protein TNCT_309031 [Trichonephila clavata]